MVSQPSLSSLSLSDFVSRLASEAKVVVELDGRRNHTAFLDREADYVRDSRLTAMGIRVMRITWRRLKREPRAVDGFSSRSDRIRSLKFDNRGAALRSPLTVSTRCSVPCPGPGARPGAKFSPFSP